MAHTVRLVRENLQEHIDVIKDHVANEFTQDFKKMDRVFEQNAEIVQSLNTIQRRLQVIDQDQRIMFANIRELRDISKGKGNGTGSGAKAVVAPGEDESGLTNNTQDMRIESNANEGIE